MLYVGAMVVVLLKAVLVWVEDRKQRWVCGSRAIADLSDHGDRGVNTVE